MTSMNAPNLNAVNSTPPNAVVLHEGVAYQVPKVPFETEEQAMDRAWWIAQQTPKDAADFRAAWGKSLIWMHEKYFGIKYVEGGAAATTTSTIHGR